jgi:hypothetical protein
VKIAVSGPCSRRDLWIRTALYLAWLGAVLFLAARHAFWRDEVRAFSIALSGDTVPDMLRNLHGEGHPALWYLLLRGTHALVPVREVLPAVAVAIAAAAMALLAFRSPFRAGVIALVLFGAFGLFEYAVTARNYGISMLVLFAYAEVYPRRRDRGVVVGLLLAVLCNTNVPSCFLAAGLLFFWAIEISAEEGLRWTRKHRQLLLNGAIAVVGVALCFVEVFPTVNDAAVTQHPGGIHVGTVVQALAVPALSFWDAVPPMVQPTSAAAAVVGVIIFGSLAGLLRAPAAFAAALAVLLVFELFFRLVYPGSYRHEALFIVYLVTLYWLVARGRGSHWPERWRAAMEKERIAAAGALLFLAFLALQLLISVALLNSELGGYPFSRSRDLAALLRREGLGSAVVIGDPEMFLEPLPYYAANPLYLMREQRFGKVVRFTRYARRNLHIADFLRDARLLRARTGRQVVIVLQHRLDPGGPAFHVDEGYVWTFSADPEETARFFAGTRRLARFGPTVTDESYDVYALR